MSKQVEVVIKAKGIQGTKWPEVDPETLERVRLGCLATSPVVQRVVIAAARAEELALRDRTVREALERHGLTEEASRSDILIAIGAEYEAAAQKLEAMFRIMTT